MTKLNGLQRTRIREYLPTLVGPNSTDFDGLPLK